MKRQFINILLVIFLASSIYSQSDSSFSIKGKVIDSSSQIPIQSAEITIQRTKLKTITDINGNFAFEKIKEGNYELNISAEGYFTTNRYINVSFSSRTIVFTISLIPFESHTDTIEVNSKYFKKNEYAPTGYINAGFEEIKKTPGTVDDVIRFFESSPGISIGDDMANEILVRGGAPNENQVIVDNIELPNPNHYGPQGTNNGLLSYINLQMIKEVNMYTGGFPVFFGDKLSGIMDIQFKPGDWKKHTPSINLSLAGFGFSAEGPLSKNITYSVSARRSYFELFKSQFNDIPVPNFWDINLKLNYSFNKDETLSFTSLAAIDNTIDPDNIKVNERKNIKVRMFSNGINFEKNNGKLNHLLTGFYNMSLYNIDYYSYGRSLDVGTAYLNSTEHQIGINYRLSYFANSKFHFEIFSGFRYNYSKDTIFTHSMINESDYYSPGIVVNKNINLFKGFIGLNTKINLLSGRMILNLGLRSDYISYLTDHLVNSPRTSLTYLFNKNTSLNLSAGIYYQSPEILWLITDNDNKNLLNLKTYNFTAGIEHYFLPNFRLNAEAYYKQYENYPVDVYNPIFMYINNGTEVSPNFIHKAVSKGNGYTTGTDINFSYKNPENGFYGTLNLSLSTSGFAALEGGVQRGEFDYGKQVLLIAGYQIQNNWSFGLRFKYAGPHPTISIDSLNSAYLGMDYYNKSQYLKVKVPYYMRIDLRIDKMFMWGNVTASFYAEVENILNRNNVFTYYWDLDLKSVEPFYHISILPMLGFNIKF